MTNPIIFTESAANKISTLREAEGNPDLKLRVYVSGGGCSGLQYNFSFEETIEEDDTVMDTNGVQLLVDAASYQYLTGATIDYVDRGLNGSEFTITNPNAQSSCGCGQSFAA